LANKLPSSGVSIKELQALPYSEGIYQRITSIAILRGYLSKNYKHCHPQRVSIKELQALPSSGVSTKELQIRTASKYTLGGFTLDYLRSLQF
jgi:hypothetical protein